MKFFFPGDDPTFLNDLVDNVDAALAKYGIDVRECVASTMCEQLREKPKNKAKNRNGLDGDDEEESSLTMNLIKFGVLKTAAK